MGVVSGSLTGLDSLRRVRPDWSRRQRCHYYRQQRLGGSYYSIMSLCYFVVVHTPVVSSLPFVFLPVPSLSPLALSLWSSAEFVPVVFRSVCLVLWPFRAFVFVDPAGQKTFRTRPPEAPVHEGSATDRRAG